MIAIPETATVAAARALPTQMTEAEVDAVLEAAEVPLEWRAPLKAIGFCESRWQPGAVGDGGASLGWLQEWRGWFVAGEDPFDPVTAARVAVRIRTVRGRFGGAGGWSCATMLGIP